MNEACIQIGNLQTVPLPDSSMKEKANAFLHASPYVTQQKLEATCDMTKKENNCDNKRDSETGESTLTFNLKQYITDNILKTGKTDFDKNHSLCRGELMYFLLYTTFLYNPLQTVYICIH